MRISRKPGETFEVDWAGATVDIHDSVTGEITPAYLFVGALSCSSFVYAELCRDMKSENFILCHVHAYEYFGGVTRLLVPDNLKTGVTQNTRYETSIPRAYQEMADYYGTAIVPARPKAPDDKPNAKGSVKFATMWILAAVRNQRFFSFEEAHDAVAEKLERLNDKPLKTRKGCRRSAYEEKVDGAILEIIEKLFTVPAFQKETSKWFQGMDSIEELTEQLKMVRKQLYHQEQQKRRLGEILDNLDILADDYDESYDNTQAEINGVYDEIERLEALLTQTKMTCEEKARERKGMLIVNPEEAEIVKIIFNEFVNEGVGADTISNYLNQHGYVKKKKRSHELNYFTRGLIRKILDNPVYIGKIA